MTSLSIFETKYNKEYHDKIVEFINTFKLTEDEIFKVFKVRNEQRLNEVYSEEIFIKECQNKLKITRNFLFTDEIFYSFEQSLKSFYTTYGSLIFRYKYLFGHTFSGMRRFLGLVNNEQPKEFEFWIRRGYPEDLAKQQAVRNVPGCYHYKQYDGLSKDEKIKKIHSMKPQCREYYNSESEFKEGKRIQDDYSIKNLNNRTYSYISKELFDSIVENLPDFFHNKVFYGENEQWINTVPSYYKPDFLYKNKIIEFYGDYWHANPINFGKNSNDYIVGKGYVKDIHFYDSIRELDIKREGYDLLIIWESDYLTNKNDCVIKCVNFLLN